MPELTGVPMMRDTLWLHILEDLGPEPGCILPMWLRFVYLILYPLQGLRLLLGNAAGYDLLRNTYTIHGIEFSAQFFLLLARSRGELYRFTCVDGIVTVQRVEAP